MPQHSKIYGLCVALRLIIIDDAHKKSQRNLPERELSKIGIALYSASAAVVAVLYRCCGKSNV